MRCVFLVKICFELRKLYFPFLLEFLFQDYAKFNASLTGLRDDCRAGVSVPIISEEGLLFESAVRWKVRSSGLE